MLLGIFSHTYAMPVEDEDGETTYKDLGFAWYGTPTSCQTLWSTDRITCKLVPFESAERIKDLLLKSVKVLIERGKSSKAQELVDHRMQQMRAEGEKTIDVERARAYTHRAISREYALERDMTPEELYAVIMEDAKAIYEDDTIIVMDACHAQNMRSSESRV